MGAVFNIVSGGDSVNMPTGTVILTDAQETRFKSTAITGQGGVAIQGAGNQLGPKSLTIVFPVRASSMANLVIAWDAISRLFARSEKVLLFDLNLQRAIWVHMNKWNVDRLRRGTRLGVSLSLMAPDGYWIQLPELRDIDVDTDTAAITSSNASTTILHVPVDYGGSVPTRPQLRFTVSGADWTTPAFTWYGRNMIPNSDMSQHTSGNDAPDSWSFSNGSPTWIQHFGFEGNHCCEIKGHTSAGSEDRIEVRTSMQESTEYTLSFRAQRTDGGGGNSDLRVVWQWLEDDGTTSTTESSESAITNIGATTWRWNEFTRTSPNATTATAKVDIQFKSRTTGHVYLITDVQLEIGDTVSQYVNTSHPRYKPVTVTRGGTTLASGDVWSIDMKAGIARVWDGSDWQDDGANWNGAMFDIHPGKNVIYVDTPTGSVAVSADIQTTEHFI
jgi:hypothetical protein